MIVATLKKTPEVIRLAWIDFAPNLVSGENILEDVGSEPTAAAYLEADDSSFPEFLTGGYILVGSILYWRIGGGNIGENVIVKMIVKTSHANTLADSLRFLIEKY